MNRYVHVVVAMTIVVGLSLTATTFAARGNSKIHDCLKTRNCKFIITGAATEDPRMSFLVLEKIWKTFSVLDKNDLKHILKAKVADANEKPDKHINVSKKASSYETLKRNIQNMRSYSVIISYGKNTRSELQLDEEILVNY
jgi:hypothetical protein